MSAIADLLEVHSIDPDTDRRKFADGLLWALITANRDAHARNYGMLIKGRRGTSRPCTIFSRRCRMCRQIV